MDHNVQHVTISRMGVMSSYAGESEECIQNVGGGTTWKTMEMEENVKNAFGKYVVRMGADWNWLGIVSNGPTLN
jgi:hypothetical protein